MSIGGSDLDKYVPATSVAHFTYTNKLAEPSHNSAHAVRFQKIKSESYVTKHASC
jgi:hypothetical protein